MSAATRATTYTFMIAVIGLALVYGLVNGDQADAWTRVADAAVQVASLLAFVLARRHVPADPPRRAEGSDDA